MEHEFEQAATRRSEGTLPPETAADWWASSIVRDVAEQVQHWRKRRGLSAKQLSDRTAELGYPVQRSVIANLENRRREIVTIAELLVLAAALNIPPTMLLTPVGRESSLEILPGLTVSPWVARGWLIGAVELTYNNFSSLDWQDGRRAMMLYDIHRLLIREYEQIETRMKRVVDQPALDAEGMPPDPRFRQTMLTEVAGDLARSINRIRVARIRISEEGFVLPELPPGLTGLLREDPQRRDGPPDTPTSNDLDRSRSTAFDFFQVREREQDPEGE